MNGRGDTVADRLRDAPRRVREVAGHGVRRGAAVALAMAQYQSGHDFQQVEPVDLADDMEMVASAISDDISIEAVIGNVFADE